MNRLLCTTALIGTVLGVGVPSAVHADPAFGLGLTFTFGGGQSDVGVGVRVFSNNRADEFAGSLGIDYMFGSESFRGSLGANYLFDDSYLGLGVGIDFNDGGFDFGIDGGFIDVEEGSGEGSAPPEVPEDTDENTLNITQIL